MPSADRNLGRRLVASLWIVLALHFATNISRELYPAIALAEHGTLAVDEYTGLHPDIFVAPSGRAFINNNPGASVVAAVPRCPRRKQRASGGRPPPSGRRRPSTTIHARTGSGSSARPASAASI
jgi:hypothetical protein